MSTTNRWTDPSGKVAVITGAGSGFGRALALACAKEGMKLSLADVNMNDLAATVALVEAAAPGTECLQWRCDVSKAAEVEQYAQQTYSRFGKAHWLFNNAGVSTAGPAWMSTAEDWEWGIGVNLMGVAYGIRSFVPRMLEQGEPGHVVNTASVAGLVTVVGSAVYCAAKHAVVAMSECLHHDLHVAKANVGVSVLCPGFVPTGIADSERNRPEHLSATNPLSSAYLSQAKKAIAASTLTADDVARITLDGLREGRFYITTHPQTMPAVALRNEAIVQGKAPFAARF
ncbi:MAG TPA: SDR family NAD(P)-dependent oxidoreductase [Rhodocyclaceae bacterium]|nr:SDR family NAD(P)-dependent oxidoreductase [Rhodocyclaceae bacterium]